MPTLCCKNKPLFDIELEYGKVVDIKNAKNEELLPVALSNGLTVDKAGAWLESRKIPKDRYYLPEVRSIFDWAEPHHYMCSLGDHFWIRSNRNERYETVNYFTRKYPSQVGEMFFMPWTVSNIDKKAESPDLTCAGKVSKRWIQKCDENPGDFTSYLHKSGSRIGHQYPAIEVIASAILKTINLIPTVEYSLVADGLMFCSESRNFVTIDTSFVPALEIKRAFFEKKKQPFSFDDYMQICEKHIVGKELKTERIADFTEKMVALAKLLDNTDMNLGNFGFIRNSNTGEFISPSPLFDIGSCMFDWGDGSHPCVFDEIANVAFKKHIPYIEKAIRGIDFNPIYELVERYPFPDQQVRKSVALHLGRMERCEFD